MKEVIIDQRDVVTVEEHPYQLVIEIATVVSQATPTLRSPNGSLWQQSIDNEGNPYWTKA